MSPPVVPPGEAAHGPGPVTILSGSIGQGHDSVALACAEALRPSGRPVELLDCMALLGARGGGAGEAVFRRLVAHPPLYDAFHFSVLRAGGPLARSMEAAAARRLLPALRRRLPEGPAGLAITVFPTGVGALGRLRAERPGLSAVALLTDATAHRLWVHDGIDRYLVGSAAAAGSVRQYRPEAQVAILPPPVRAAFFDAPGRDEARARLGLEGGAPAALLIAGAWGIGPLEELAVALSRAGIGVLAVAGRNESLRRALAGVAARARRGGGAPVEVFGHTDRLPELMAAAEVVVTSPGQTCHEARVVGRPLVILDAVPGHGRENLLLELARGGALACPPRPGAVLAATSSALAGGAGALAPWPVAGPQEWGALLRGALAGPLGPPAGS